MDNTRSMKMIFPKIKKIQKKNFFSHQILTNVYGYSKLSTTIKRYDYYEWNSPQIPLISYYPTYILCRKIQKKTKIINFLFWGISHLYEIMYLKNQNNILNIAIVNNFHKIFNLIFLDPRSLVEFCSLLVSLNTESRISSVF